MRKYLVRFGAAALALGFSAAAQAQVEIDNGIVGDGFWAVTVENAGDSRIGVIDPIGAQGPTDVIFSLNALYDNGADGSDGALASNTTSPAALTGPGQVTSSGTFPGPNGTINWTAVAMIAPNSPLYTVRYNFSSSAPFGVTRIINYFDEDVLGAGNDIVVVIGTPGTNSFQLLTVESSADVGVALAADYLGASNMTWAGWAIDNCCGAPSVYSVVGETGGLAATTDARFPDNPVYGPADVTTNMAWDFNPSATTASMLISIGGSPDGSAPPPPQPQPPTEAIPVPVNSAFALALLTLLLGAAALVALRRYH